ncbi:MAG: DUF3253 domain-containing protein [Pirellulaceae bacterium]|nr:DUF3253 domain-containing protein [Pirellulaceae bacterium]
MRTRWMQQESQEPDDKEIRDEILRMLMMDAPGTSICPTDVARSLRSYWRQWMPLVREIAAEMARDGEIEVIHQDKIVDIETAKGPVRLRLVRHETREGSSSE